MSIPSVTNVLVGGDVLNAEGAKLVEKEDQETEGVEGGDADEHLGYYWEFDEVIIVVYLVCANDENRDADGQSEQGVEENPEKEAHKKL